MPRPSVPAIMLALAVVPAGATEVAVLTPERAIAPAAIQQPLTEPRPAVSLTDSRHLVIGAIVAPVAEEDPWDCAALTTRDGGRTWSVHRFGVDRCIDPWVVFVDGERLSFTAIEIRRDGAGDDRLELFTARSGDGGRTWSATRPLGRGFEHPLVALRRTAVAAESELILAARRTRRAENGHPRHTVAVFTSGDGGAAFEPLAEVYPSNAGLTTTGLAALPGGGLYVSFYDFQRNTGGFKDDGMLAGARAWGLYSADGGRTFSIPLLIDDRCGLGAPGAAFPGYPYLTAGRSGRLYHVCLRPGLDGLALSYSDDGEAWSQPRRLDGAGEGRGRALTPMLAAGARGVLVAWQDRRENPDCQYLYAAASADHGESFGPPRRISAAASCPASPQNGRAGRSWAAGGDYSSIVADAHGRFHVVWADARSGRFVLYHQILGIAAD